jgi:hypothetical protein
MSSVGSVDHASDAGHDPAHLLRRRAQGLEVLAEDAHHERLAGAGELAQRAGPAGLPAADERADIANALLGVGDDRALHAAQAGDRVAHRRDRPVVVGARVDVDPELAGAHVDDLVAGDRTPDVGAGIAHARDRLERARRVAGDARHRRLRRARPGVEVHEQVGILERRDDRRAEQRDRRDRDDRACPGDQQDRSRAPDDPGERRAVKRAETAHERGLAAGRRGPLGEQEAQRRRHAQRDDRRRQHRHDVGDRERVEERAGAALHDDDGQHREQHDDERVHHRTAQRRRRLEHDRAGRRPAARGALLAQASRHALGPHDRVADDDRHRHGQPREGDRVHRRAEQLQHERARDERQRPGEQARQDGPPAHEQGGQGEREQRGPDDDREREVADRVLDEARGPEDVRVGPHAGQTGPQVVERRLDAARDGERVGARQLLDDEHEAAAAVDDRVADQRLMVLDDLRDVAQAQVGAGVLDRDVRQGGRRRQPVEHVADLQALGRRLDEAAGSRGRRLQERERRDELGVARRRDDLVERDVLLAQAPRVDLHLQLLIALTPDRDVRDAADAEQPRPDRPASEDALLDRRERAGAVGQPDHQHAARRRRRVQHQRRLGHVGQRVRLRQALLDEGAPLVEVRARLEDQDDRRQARDGLRSDRVDARDAVEQVGLQRDRDELLDLVGRQAQRLGLDLRVWRRELGQDVDRRLAQLDDAEGHHASGDDEDE